MKTSIIMVNLLKLEEGFRSSAYKDGFVDGKQKYSIGYGHQILVGESHLMTKKISEKEGTEIFQKDLVSREAVINKTKRPLRQNQFDALISFTYNAGAGAGAKVLKTWEDTGDPKKVCDHMKLYNKWTVNGKLEVHQGLVTRRIKETAYFMLDHYAPKAVGITAF